MGIHRMFSARVVESDPFLDLPLTAQALYYHLGMAADDRGIVLNPRSIMRQCGATNGDMQSLLQAKFILAFNDTGAIVLKHWYINNKLRKDRLKETTQLDLLARLYFDENGSYSTNPAHACRPCLPVAEQLEEVNDNQTATICQPTGNQMATNCQPTGNQLTAQAEAKRKQSKAKQSKVNLIDQYAADSVELANALQAFVAMRTKIRKPMTDRAVELLLKELDKYPAVERVPILEQSIEHSWSGIYPLKTEQAQTNPRHMVTAAEMAAAGPDEMAMRAVAARRARREAEQVQG